MTNNTLYHRKNILISLKIILNILNAFFGNFIYYFCIPLRAVSNRSQVYYEICLCSTYITPYYKKSDLLLGINILYRYV